MLFQKPSLRTRVTFDAGMTQLGGSAIYLTNDTVLGARESVRDVARNLERFVDAIVARTGPHEVVVELASQASIPVINGLTLREHPCQALADVFTIGEHLDGRLAGAVVAFVGDGNNVYHSLALLGAALGMEIRLAHPAGYAPNERIVARAEELAAASGGRLVFGSDPAEIVRGADVVYTDAWTSMGQEAEAEERRDAFAGYQVDEALMEAAGPIGRRDALPAGASRRGDHLRGDGRPAQHHLRPVREPAPRPEGPPRRTARRRIRRVINDLFERYKLALRRGHVAASRGQLDEAVVAYREAIDLAPDRVLPYTGLSGVLVRLDRPAEALTVLERPPSVRRPTDRSGEPGPTS